MREKYTNKKGTELPDIQILSLSWSPTTGSIGCRSFRKSDLIWRFMPAKIFLRHGPEQPEGAVHDRVSVVTAHGEVVVKMIMAWVRYTWANTT